LDVRNRSETTLEDVVSVNMQNGGKAKSWKSRVLKQCVDLLIL